MPSIGNLKINSKVMLAPMTGVTDLPYRTVCRRHGCRMAFTEMVNVKGVVYNSRRTFEILRTDGEDSPLGLQVLANEEKYIRPALEKIEGMPFRVIDLNAACPVKKNVLAGYGAALMKDPEKLKKMLGIMVRHAGRPVTVKIRTGWDGDSVNAADISRMAEDAGVSAVFIHGRTREQLYSGGVDYDTIRRVKESLGIPVIGSGNVFSPELAKKMLEETGCDAVLVARGSQGNPWIFADAENFLSGSRMNPRPGPDEIAEVMRSHLDMSIAFYGAFRGIRIFRKVFIYYTKCFINSKPLRRKVVLMKDKASAEDMIEEFRVSAVRHGGIVRSC
ncbi:MAG: tRNA dihydrouridine synthase DusB [Elusimicrobia bacterium]|nr:tRNA dihydrouridine synthase DusB [Elusimicrobiota bacterium]